LKQGSSFHGRDSSRGFQCKKPTGRPGSGQSEF
jgi:hypothetical protein